MKNLILFIVALLVTNYTTAQSVAWTKTMGSSSFDGSNAMILDAAGNIYTTGYFSGTVDFDPSGGVYNLTSNGNKDIYIQKLDAAGNFIWAKAMGGTSDDEGNSIALDNFGNIYTTGYFHGTVDFDPSSGTLNIASNNGSKDVYVQKLDTAGNFVWAKIVGGSSYDSGLSLVLDGVGNIYTTGYFNSTMDFDPSLATYNLSSAGARDIFIQKLDTAGNFIWAKKMGSSNFDYGSAMTIDHLGNIYTTGHFSGTVDFDPNPTTYNLISNGSYDIFIQKLDTAGNFIWAKKMGSSSNDEGSSITTDYAGNIYTTGHFSNTVDFDPSPNTYNLNAVGNDDIFIQKLDMSGNFIWAKAMGGSSYDYGTAIVIDKNKNVFIAGNFQGTADFNPSLNTYNLSATGGRDMFIQKLDSLGNFVWAEKIGSLYDDYIRSIAIDSLGSLHLAGNYYASFTGGFSRIFLRKYSCTPNFGRDKQTVCNSYTWIDGNTYTSSNNTAIFNIVGGAINGCDSVAMLDLTIKTVDTALSVTNNSLTVNAIGADYQWLDCTNNYAPIIGETAQTFTPSANGSYAVEVIQNGCIDSSQCTAIIITNTEKIPFFNRVTISPNPTEGLISIDLGSLKDASIKVYNINGHVLYQKDNINNTLHQFELDVVSGVYIVEISSHDQKQQYKLIKK